VEGFKEGTGADEQAAGTKHSRDFAQGHSWVFQVFDDCERENERERVVTEGQRMRVSQDRRMRSVAVESDVHIARMLNCAPVSGIAAA
jgi:hypothetical protein